MTDHNDLPTLYWKNSCLFLLDQRLLPLQVEYRACSTAAEVSAAIAEMTVRGAPAIGISAAFGLAMAAAGAEKYGATRSELDTSLEEAAQLLLQSRPTAVNLQWAVERMISWLKYNPAASTAQAAAGLEQEAEQILEEDREINRLIGHFGAGLIPEGSRILTHCNAGALATGGYGTALGIIRTAAQANKNIHVYIDETRPLLQGSRITAFELTREKIPATLVTDNCAGHLMSGKLVDMVIVGADRIAANGDTANKIGTYQLAVLASYHAIPFYIAAPLSTIDLSIHSGKEIIIEERCRSEITHLKNICLAPPAVAVYNPAFDVTPALLITALVTERGVVHEPGEDKLLKLFHTA